MAKNTKPKFERRIVTAIRDSSPVSPDFYVEPKIEVKPKKPNNMDMARKVLTEANGRISIDDAVKRLLEVHTLRTENPIPQARKIFLHANRYNLPVKITVENNVKYIELA